MMVKLQKDQLDDHPTPSEIDEAIQWKMSTIIRQKYLNVTVR